MQTFQKISEQGSKDGKQTEYKVRIEGEFRTSRWKENTKSRGRVALLKVDQAAGTQTLEKASRPPPTATESPPGVPVGGHQKSGNNIEG